MADIGSPCHLQCELKLTGRGRGRRDQSRGGYGRSVGAEQGVIGYRRGKVRVIEHVEELRAELKVEAVGDSPDLIVFDEREIEVREAGTDQAVSSRIS